MKIVFAGVVSSLFFSHGVHTTCVSVLLGHTHLLVGPDVLVDLEKLGFSHAAKHADQDLVGSVCVRVPEKTPS